jgi:hypothetical protein
LNLFECFKFVDEIIGKVSDVLSSHFPDYVALLTADMPRDVSMVISEFLVRLVTISCIIVGIID